MEKNHVYIKDWCIEKWLINDKEIKHRRLILTEYEESIVDFLKPKVNENFIKIKN